MQLQIQRYALTGVKEALLCMMMGKKVVSRQDKQRDE